MPAPHIFIATHHKSGTVWMITTFRRIAKANGLEFVHLNTGESGWDIRPDKLEYFEQQRAFAESKSDLPAIFVDYHSAIPDLTNCKASRGAAGIHIIRDPRDMLLSAVRYHLVSDEPWLHQPSKSFAGQTYQQKLIAISNLEDQVQFEIDNHMGQAILEMHAFDDQEIFKAVKYEDMIVDRNMTLFHEILIHLGFHGRETIRGLNAFWESSIFGDRSEHDKQTAAGHVFDSSPAQWKSGLSRSCLDRIESQLGSAIENLGYPIA
ncbi:MAG: hypothetical protein JKX70_00900 [Phycisphaerales bacterium]|nr:hypothetical protein [Phycisphaerales bacterium]